MLPPRFGLPEVPWIVAHRGASADHPENTVASVEAAVALGAHMIEIDVQLTADDELVLVHDLVVGGLVVEESPAETVRHRLRETSGRELATLPEALAAVPEALPINVEIKHRRAGHRRVADRLLTCLGERERILVSSFDWEMLALLRRASPPATLAPIGKERPHELLRAAEALGAAAVHCHRRLAFSDFIAAARSGGWPVLVYTINDIGLASALFERGAAGIFTDRPGEMLAGLASA